MRPAAPDVRVKRWNAGAWSESPDAVVMEEPLQLLLDGEPLSVVMRTPGNDIELTLGLLFAEGVIRTARDVKALRISAESGERESALEVDSSVVESNVIDVRLSAPPERRPERSMLASSACGVCGAVMIEDLRRGLSRLGDGPDVQASVLPGLVNALRAGQGVFERTGGLHAAGLFSAGGDLLCLREDVGRHNALDKVAGRQLLDGKLPASDSVLVVSGRAGYEIVQKSIAAGIPILAAVGAPSSLAVALAREFGQTLVGFLRDERFNVYSAPERLT
ncbi:MAG TPA: formate dehydrogenase accessory sulfurtransferase FdhD [Candidatus Dormibacteraeota bacterium]|nr:formate dehydrogenase accessory sulfurtransferase FdhD [Candidatus Dormibacteraeota bacterium]